MPVNHVPVQPRDGLTTWRFNQSKETNGENIRIESRNPFVRPPTEIPEDTDSDSESSESETEGDQDNDDKKPNEWVTVGVYIGSRGVLKRHVSHIYWMVDHLRFQTKWQFKPNIGHRDHRKQS